ncbi:hypothetical protein [Cellulosimicrobium sp. Marseille-Q4280]|uniref:hypothetical protein n=1 Tax=Cellulosimicrobium sp. Marseille-Q4280 TaxID=2937992 RepID=UPI0020418054|nr:hypothetical protein [Cellulosimicrobium sp. Marseille-Q4280]
MSGLPVVVQVVVYAVMVAGVVMITCARSMASTADHHLADAVRELATRERSQARDEAAVAAHNTWTSARQSARSVQINGWCCLAAPLAVWFVPLAFAFVQSQLVALVGWLS